MIQKSFVDRNGDGVIARVTFSVPASAHAETVHLVGDFNNWDRTSHPLRRRSDGDWTITVDLEPSRMYRFSYLLDGIRWLNDTCADAYVHHLHRNDSSVVITDRSFRPYVERTGPRCPTTV